MPARTPATPAGTMEISGRHAGFRSAALAAGLRGDDRRRALVHFSTEGEITPNPGLLCDDRMAPDGIRASGRQHPIEYHHADSGLGLLTRKAAGS
jgi:hypothetical protein